MPLIDQNHYKKKGLGNCCEWSYIEISETSNNTRFLETSFSLKT